MNSVINAIFGVLFVGVGAAAACRAGLKMAFRRSLPAFVLSLCVLLLLLHRTARPAEPTPFAEGGALKMLYDNRMYPQAIEQNGGVYIVWRGERGLPYIIRYDLKSREFSKPFMLLTGRENRVDAKRLANDHHYAPVVWTDREGYLHVLFGCHRTPGVHLMSQQPGEMTRWRERLSITDSISYPKVHRIDGGRTLVYYRYSGHLGSWTYRISSDGLGAWLGPEHSVVDLDSAPQDGTLAGCAGSYETTRVSRDGRALHAAFIWKVEDPVFNSRYKCVLGDHTQRYNLYYLKVDLASGEAFNVDGQKLATPVRKSVADRSCIVWDTDQRVAAVGPSICLDEQDRPYFLLPVSEETPYRCRFWLVRRRGGEWERTPITRTSHPFNACHLERTGPGRLNAYLVVGDGESIAEKESEDYGWGDRIEQWSSSDDGRTWTLRRDLTPRRGWRYQNIKCVRTSRGGIRPNLLLFYGWRGARGEGAAFLWDNRE